MSDQLEVLIRMASVEDCQEIMAMIKELADYQNVLSKLKINTNDLIENGFGTQPNFKCLVAEVINKGEAKTLQGYLLYSYKFNSFVGKAILMEDFYVRPAYRNMKIGIRLLKTFFQLANADKVQIVEFIVSTENQKSIEFYLKTGAENASQSEGWNYYKYRKPAMLHMADILIEDKCHGK